MNQLSRRLRFFAALALAGALLLPAGCASKRQQTAHAPVAQASQVSRPVERTPPPAPPVIAQEETTKQPDVVSAVSAAPSNLRNFSPKDTNTVSLPIPAEQVDLKKLFEELGEDTTLWYQHVQTLANPFFGGRAPGTRGDEIAAEYIEFYFKLYNLEPAFPSEVEHMGSTAVREWSSYRQRFDFGAPNPDVKIVKAEASLNGKPLKEGEEFVILGNSGNGDITGPVTFVGYGIAEGNDGYTSFEENTDLTGRIALVMRYEPLDETGKSQWSNARFSTHSSIANKLQNVAERGAAAIILVNPPGAVDGKTTLETISDSRRFGRRLGIPAVQVSAEVADRMLANAHPERRDLLAWRIATDFGEIKTVTLDNSVQVALNCNLEVDDRLHTHNVAAVLRGKGNLSEEWLVIGGHYDHIGFGYTGAMPQNIGRLHPGADDNASGTASVLIAARRFSQMYAKSTDDANLRSIVFIGFAGEEAGLHGSKYFVENPPMSLGAINLMFNLDMVGRLRDNSVLAQGTGTAEGFADMLKPFFESSGIKVAASPGGRGPSDHASFYAKNIPVLFLFTGTHDDYHRPSDYAYTVNPSGAMKIVELLDRLAAHFASTPERLRFSASAAPAGPGRQTGARVSLGTMPDYTAELETGMRVDGITEDSSAADAGIQPGDILLTWNGAEIAGARSIAEFLNNHRPGDKVTIILRRGNEEIPVEVTLRARSQQ